MWCFSGLLRTAAGYSMYSFKGTVAWDGFPALSTYKERKRKSEVFVLLLTEICKVVIFILSPLNVFSIYAESN
jgi:hypothetical protein